MRLKPSVKRKWTSRQGPPISFYPREHEKRRDGNRGPHRGQNSHRNVHVFARYHTEDYSGPPSNHSIIFDEAQRAWDRAQNEKKFKRDYSEPEMLLRIMERHQDWAVVVALVGGGQEIK
jgi:hypothetical protein